MSRFTTKTILLASVWIATTGSISVDYRAYKSTDGILVISERPGQFFSVDIPGEKIHPVSKIHLLGTDEAVLHHPYFMVGNRCLQLMPVPIAEFKGNPAADDEAILRAQAQYEINYWKPISSDIKKIALRKGKTGLLYSFRIRRSGSGNEKQMFVTFRENHYVVVLASNVPKGDSDKKVRDFLIRVASSFRGSKSRIPRPAVPPYTG
jgi:hypothetical protein